jgi:hypothetical protein
MIGEEAKVRLVQKWLAVFCAIPDPLRGEKPQYTSSSAPALERAKRASGARRSDIRIKKP